MTESSSRRVTHFLFHSWRTPSERKQTFLHCFPVSPPLRLRPAQISRGTAASGKYAARIASPPGEWGPRDHVFTSAGHAHAGGLGDTVGGALFSLGRGARPCRKSRAHRKGRNAKRPIHFQMGRDARSVASACGFWHRGSAHMSPRGARGRVCRMPMTRTIEQIVRVSRLAGSRQSCSIPPHNRLSGCAQCRDPASRARGNWRQSSPHRKSADGPGRICQGGEC